jgi:hypothetical protein
MSTELATQPNQYEASLDDEGNYVDRTLTKSAFARGLKCGCGTAVVFFNNTNFKQHCKTDMHNKWLQILNQNKNNHLAELLELRELVKQQQLLIAERDKRIIDMEGIIRTRETTIRTLSSMMNTTPIEQSEEVNLLDIDV